MRIRYKPYLPMIFRLLTATLIMGFAFVSSAQIVLDNFDDNDKSGWFSGSSKYELSTADEALVVDVFGTYSWRVFGYEFDPIDMSTFSIITVKVKIPDTVVKAPIMRIDLSDHNGFIGNASGFNFTPIKDGEFHTYTLNYKNRLKQGWNSNGDPESQNLDVDNIVKLEFFINPGAAASSPWSGVIIIDDIVFETAQDPFIFANDQSWEYLDNGFQPQSSWLDTGFVDTSWKKGGQSFGYGTAVETEVSYGEDSLNKYITTYFRKEFNISDTTAFENLIVDMIIDDAAIVYLNGEELIRENLPLGAIDSSTLAIIHNSAPRSHHYVFPIEKLDSGLNVIAVEVHQGSSSSADLFFELHLEATSYETGLIRGPYLQSSTDTSIVVKWRTLENTTGSLFYGASAATLNTEVTDTVSQTDHELVLKGLNPYTKYFYMVTLPNGDTLAGGDATHFFRTHPTNSHTEPVNIWVVGDAGKTSRDQRAMRNAYKGYMRNKETDLWLILGDNAYQEGTDREYQRAMFQNMFEEEMTHTKLFPAPGNHDLRKHFDDPTEAAYYDIFTLPTQGEAGGVASGTEAYYSYDYGDIHFVSLDSYATDRDSLGTMGEWLEEDLSTSTKKWKVVYFHHPPYSKGSHDSDDPEDSDSDALTSRMIEMRSMLVPTMERNGVDLVLTGHSHNYERSHLINGHYGFSETFLDQPHIVSHTDNPRLSGNRDLDEAYYKNPKDDDLPNKGTIYAVMGCSALKVQTADWEKQQDNLITNALMHYSTKDYIGSLSLTIHGDTLDARFIDTDTLTRDYFSLIKDENKEISLVTGSASGLNETGYIENILDVYPNPYRDEVTVSYELESTETVALELTDQQGRIVHRFVESKQGAGKYQIKVNPEKYGLPQGTYFFRLVTEERMYTRQLIKVN